LRTYCRYTQVSYGRRFCTNLRHEWKFGQCIARTIIASRIIEPGMRKVAIVLITLPLLGCPGLLDFSAPLSGGYFLHRSSSEDIRIAPETAWDYSTPTIPPMVVELAYDAKWIIATQRDLPPRSPNEPDPAPIPEAVNHWILNVQLPRVWGPLTEQKFKRQRSELGVSPQLKLKYVYEYTWRSPSWPESLVRIMYNGVQPDRHSSA
jgi:hypothetical protein